MRILNGFLFFLFLLCPILVTGHSVHALDFSTADLEGEWRGYFLESWTDPGNGDSASYWIYGDMTVDREGRVTGGTWTAMNDTTGVFDGGTLAIDRGGVLTGTINTRVGAAAVETMSLSHAKMARGKGLVQGVGLKNDGKMNLLTMIRKETTSVLDDLSGSWSGFMHSTNGVDNADVWSLENLTMQNGDVITGGNWESVLAGLTGLINTPGEFSVENATGDVSWNLLSSHFDLNGNIQRRKLESRSGRMTPSKSVLAGVGAWSDDVMDFGVFLKRGTGYQSTDIQGTWAGYFSEISSGWIYWIYGAITLDAEGNCTGGTWQAASGATGTFTGGSVSLAADGKLTGTLNSSDGKVTTIRAGFMDSGKSMAAAVVAKDNGAADLVYLLKMEPVFSWPMFLPAVTNTKQ